MSSQKIKLSDISGHLMDDMKPQPEVGTNTGSKDMGTRVAGGELRADILPVGNAVTPPQPDKEPVAGGADELKRKHDFACQTIRELTAIVNEQTEIIGQLRAERMAGAEAATRYILGYAVIPGQDTLHLLASEEEARKHAEFLITEEPDLYTTANLVAILDTCELAPAWHKANHQLT